MRGRTTIYETEYAIVQLRRRRSVDTTNGCYLHILKVFTIKRVSCAAQASQTLTDACAAFRLHPKLLFVDDPGHVSL